MKRTLALLVMAVCLTASAIAGQRFRTGSFVAKDTLIDVGTFDAESGGSVTIDVRACLRGDRPSAGQSRRWWGIAFGGDCRLTVRGYNSAFGEIDDVRLTDVTLTGGDTVVARERRVGLFADGSYNTLTLAMSADGKISVRGGETLSEPLFEARVNSPSGPIGVFTNGTLDVAEAVVETERPTLPEVTELRDVAALTDSLRVSANRYEGIWESLDRDNDPRYARQGGRYLLATVDNGHGAYDIVYLGGAEVNASFWRPGMLKGRMKPTIFTDRFDLEWFDSSGKPVTPGDCEAKVEQGAILVVHFPLLKTTLRFSRRRPSDI